MALRVLSLDGGGVRGILTARILVELEELSGKPISDQFDLIAGTSSGAILALALSMPGGDDGAPRYSAEQLLDVYLTHAPKLFPVPRTAGRLPRLLGFAAAGGPGFLARLLRDVFGQAAIGDARIDVIVPTFDLGTAAPLIIRSGEFAAHREPLMSEIALASATLPTHFAPVQIEFNTRVFHLVHGGLVANNPSVIAYTSALASADSRQVALVSLGSGAPRPVDSLPPYPRGPHHWPSGAAGSFEAHLDSASEAQHQMLASLLAATSRRESYWRIQVPLDRYPQAGHSHDVEGLAMLADQFVEANQSDLRTVTEALA